MEPIIERFYNDFDFIKIKVNDFEYVFSSCGASLYSLRKNNVPLILELEDKKIFLSSPQFFNKTLGMVAGRLPVNYENNGVRYHLKDTGNNICLHGGVFTSLSFKAWKYKIKESKNKIDVIFTISPRKGENGFTGKVKIYNIYSLYKNKPGFKIIQKANIKEDSLLSLSNHIYWNLNTININDYSLKFNASKIGKVNDDLLMVDTIKTPDYLIFNRKSKLKSRLDQAAKLPIGTIDNTFIFDDKINKVLMENEKYLVKLKTDYPAMNIYCDSSLTPVQFVNNPNLKERRGIALEPQLYLLDKDSIFYKKGQKYNHYIEYIILEK